MDLGVLYQICINCGAQSAPPKHVSPLAEHKVVFEAPIVVDVDDIRDAIETMHSSKPREEKERMIREMVKWRTELLDDYIIRNLGNKNFKKFEMVTDRANRKTRIFAERYESIVEGSEEEGRITVKCPVCGATLMEWKR